MNDIAVVPTSLVPFIDNMLEPVEAHNLRQYAAETARITHSATSRPIDTEADHAIANELLTAAGIAERSIEEILGRYTKPLRAELENYYGIRRPLVEALQEAQRQIKKRMLAWQNAENAQRQRAAEERQRLAAEAAAREHEAAERARMERERADRMIAAAKGQREREAAEAAKAAALKSEREAAEAALVKEQQLAASESRPVLGSRTESGTTSRTGRWVVSVVKPELVPREFCAPSQALLDAALKMAATKARVSGPDAAPEFTVPGCAVEFLVGLRNVARRS